MFFRCRCGPATVSDNEWNPDDYDDDHAFVYERASDLLALLDAADGEQILDLGCGTGHLTARIAESGASVVGIDADEAMISEARETYPALDFRVADARSFALSESVDAVFSNAALHWIPDDDHDAVLDRVVEALADGGRFVAELGGHGNVATITDALAVELAERGYEFEHPWYFPTVGEYASRLEGRGFEVREARLFDRPTELDGGEAGLRNWIGMFGDAAFEGVPDAEREAVLDAVEARCRSELFDDETWTADYRRLRFRAVLTKGTFNY